MSHDHVVTAADEVPAGFERGPSGLLVPADTRTREREAWRREDSQVLRRAYALAKLHNLLFMVGCNDNRCAEMPLVTRHELPDGGFALICHHKERLITKGPAGRR